MKCKCGRGEFRPLISSSEPLYSACEACGAPGPAWEDIQPINELLQKLADLIDVSVQKAKYIPPAYQDQQERERRRVIRHHLQELELVLRMHYARLAPVYDLFGMDPEPPKPVKNKAAPTHGVDFNSLMEPTDLSPIVSAASRSCRCEKCAAISDALDSMRLLAARDKPAKDKT